jgi:lysyl-tRNA synthetase class 1
MNFNYEKIKNKILAWPFKEAEKILQKIGNKIPEKGYVLFETGYGPSGLPHIGTFGEVTRTIMVMNALKILNPSIPTKIFVYSDDMDGLRKVPENVPNSESLKNEIGKPLTSIPDPFGQFESYAYFMNNKLKTFLDHFGFYYEFQSSTKHYKSGKYNNMLHKVIENEKQILNVMQPSLGEERSANYHPMLPINPKTGKFIFDGVISCDAVNDTITFKDENGEIQTISALDGNVKLQWKIDWAMRWAALGVDYEMHGKDLTPTAILSTQICKILGLEPPILYVYEMFTDEHGQKISKSKGNGVSMDDWLEFGTLESIALFMYEHPERSKKLYFGTIPENVDKYLKYAKELSLIHIDENSDEETLAKYYNNPAFHIPLARRLVSENFHIDFSLILNLASACNPENPQILLDYISKYQANLTNDEKSIVNELVEKALNYYNKLIKPNKKFPELDDDSIRKLEGLKAEIEQLFVTNSKKEDSEIQQCIFDTAKKLGYEKSTMKDWFKFLYLNLFGQESGPKFGSFVNIYGWENFVKLIEKRISEK